jgi:non-homologous end joining protein Ku
MYESLRVVREEMKLAETFIKRVSDKAKRQAFVDRYEQARVPLVRAVNAGHKFVYDDLQSNLANAQKRVQELLAELANQRR